MEPAERRPESDEIAADRRLCDRDEMDPGERRPERLEMEPGGIGAESADM
jgi:hypothetical protein